MFVCVGNNVRSAFAEFFFLKMLSQKNDGFGTELSVLSAGFVPQKLKEQLAQAQIGFPEPFFGRPMSESTQIELFKRGIEVPMDWRSKELNPKTVGDADLIITMLPEIREELTHLFPEDQDKIFTLRDMSEWHGYFFVEDFAPPPLNENYWHFVEEDPEFVSRMLQAVESSLVRAFPNVIRKLGSKSTPGSETAH